ncbi:DUF3106 domain-containing protein [Engelhardtia mirabilis]|uniref:Uncharacterized protein n=1 Tax=Engelhardtia mirabilis TaxID=2528011 RepID=A0A518BDF2_9BACT|nr:hypothetical protein Pla133_00440 [Planctomycetes bacterium Pla133]QDU99308.1 hypothetical protein Pla86_00440 [Planctomycetes bacterium Pla86]
MRASASIATPRWAAAIAFAVALVGPGWTAPAVGQESNRKGPECGPDEDAASRWDRMDPERRAEMKRRFEQFRSLDDDQRQALRDRTRQLRSERDRLRDGLSEEERAKLDGLGPQERDELLRHHQEAVARARGERLLGLLPPPVIEELEGVHPADRPGVLHHWRDDFHDRNLGRALERAGRDLGLDPAAIGAVRLAPPEIQAQTLREWSSRLGGERPPWAGAGPPLPAGPLGQHPELLRELQDLARPTLEDGLAVGGLQRRERMEVLDGRIKARLLQHVIESGYLAPAELEALRAADAHELLQSLRGGRRSFDRHGWGSGGGDPSGGDPGGRWKSGDPDGRWRPGGDGPRGPEGPGRWSKDWHKDSKDWDKGRDDADRDGRPKWLQDADRWRQRREGVAPPLDRPAGERPAEGDRRGPDAEGQRPTGGPGTPGGEPGRPDRGSRQTP